MTNKIKGEKMTVLELRDICDKAMREGNAGSTDVIMCEHLLFSKGDDEEDESVLFTLESVDITDRPMVLKLKEYEE